MTQRSSKRAHVTGRPPMNLKRRCIGLTEEDHDWLKTFGLGNVSSGVREAVKQLRKLKGLPL